MVERAAVYARISEDPRQLEAGVTRQRADCEALVESRGWELVGTFADNDVAVLRPGARRPEYDALMAAVDRGEVTRVVAYGLSRLWRSRTERAAAIERLKARRVSVTLVKGSDLDMTSAAGRTYAGILGEVDTGESEVKAERVARAALQRAEEGRASGHVAFGWRRVRERRPNGDVLSWHDEIDEDAARIVREIVRRLLEREPLSAIARDLTARRVPTPRAWLRRAGGDADDGDPGEWGTGTVRKVAMRPANVGRIVRSRELVGPGGVRRVREEFGDALAPPLVDRADHDRVVALLADPTRTTTTRRGTGSRARPGARLHLLTYGIGECGVCGGHLRVVHRAGHAMYACDSSTGCVGRRQEWVDDLVGRIVVGRLERDDARDLLRRDDPGAAAVRERASQLRARLASAADAFADGDIDREQLARITSRLRPELEQAERDSARAVRGVAPSMLSEMIGSRAAALWSGLDVSRRRALLEALGLTVTILPARGGAGFKPSSVRVDWRSYPTPPA